MTDDGGRLLLVRRAHEPWRDHWTAPGGFCDETEHPIAAAERETREETGLEVAVTGYLGTWLSPYDGDETIAIAFYHARPAADAECAPDPAEVAEARWFDADSLPGPVAPPGTFAEVLAAWRRAVADGATSTPLYDRPTELRTPSAS